MQSRVVHTLEIEQHPDHVADAAAAHKGEEHHLSKHEETVQAEQHNHTPGDHMQPDLRLHHGKEAAAIAAKAKLKDGVKPKDAA